MNDSIIDFIKEYKNLIEENKNLINKHQKNTEIVISKIKNEYSKLTNDLNDHYKELLQNNDKEYNNQIVSYQKGIKELSSMNRMLIFMILICYYIFLFLKYYF